MSVLIGQATGPPASAATVAGGAAGAASAGPAPEGRAQALSRASEAARTVRRFMSVSRDKGILVRPGCDAMRTLLTLWPLCPRSARLRTASPRFDRQIAATIRDGPAGSHLWPGSGLE